MKFTLISKNAKIISIKVYVALGINTKPLPSIQYTSPAIAKPTSKKIKNTERITITKRTTTILVKDILRNLNFKLSDKASITSYCY